MSSVWYIGRADRRIIESGDWSINGVDDPGYFEWNAYNGWSLPRFEFTEQQIAWLDANPDFWTNAPDGPRVAATVAPETLITFAILREYLAGVDFKTLVSLEQVDNTHDLDKPISNATLAALLLKLNRPTVDGVDGQVVAWDSNAPRGVRWVAPAGSTSVAVQQVADPDAPSGFVYIVTGNGVAPLPDEDVPSGTVYSVT